MIPWWLERKFVWNWFWTSLQPGNHILRLLLLLIWPLFSVLNSCVLAFLPSFIKDDLLGQLSYIWRQDLEDERWRKYVRNRMTSINIENKSGSYILIITSFLKWGRCYSRSDKAFLCYYVYFTTTINFETLCDFN